MSGPAERRSWPGALGRARARADGARLALRFLRHTGLLRALRPGGLVRFARRARRERLGPHQVLNLHACLSPDREALVFEGRRWTYAALTERIARLGRGLAAAGVRAGDTVGLLLGNTSEFVEAQMAVASIGATAVSIGCRLKAPEVRYILQNAGCRALLFDAEYEAAAVGGAREVGTSLLVASAGRVEGARAYEDVIAESAALPPLRSEGRGAGGVMVYTSGTTGNPKGAHRDLARLGLDVVANYALEFPLSHDERHLCVCPLYHSAAPAYVGLTFAVGGTVVLARHFDPEEALDLIDREKCTSTTMVPTMLARIFALPEEARARREVSSLRWVMSVAAPLPTELARRAEAYFGPVLYNMYGATETGFVALAKPGEHTARPGTVGRVIAGNSVRLYDEEGRDATRTGVGEIYVKNSMMMSGYHRNAEATRRASRDGHLSVGDLGRFDGDGYLYVVDRKIDMVISGGVNIYPLEIEQCLHRHPAVQECAVVGVPDVEWGERIEAFVVPRAGAEADAAALDRHCREHLADYKRPRRFRFVGALPRTETGKVLKRDLRDRAAAEAESRSA